jgi:hypothetical protein
MRKGFFLTESEKNRISGLYNNKLFLIEAVDPPKDAEEVKAFQDWMDAKYPSGWAKSKSGTLFTIKKKQSNGYGVYPMRPQTKLAWEDDSKGGVYRKEKGNVTVSSDKTWWVWSNGTYDGPYTQEDIISKTKVFPETLVSHPTFTSNQFKKAYLVPQLGLPVPYSSSTGSFTSSTGTNMSSYGEFKGTDVKTKETERDQYFNQEEKTTPKPENLLYRQKTTQGFQDWAKKNMNVSFNTDPSVMSIDGNKLTTTEGGVTRVYYYNDKTQEWQFPNMSNNITIDVQPGPKQ